MKATEAFRAAVYKENADDQKISLKLISDSHKASTLLYSSTNSGVPACASNLPRLVIEYSPPPPEILNTLNWSQHQQNREHTGRTAWIPFKNPTGFSLAKINMPKINGSIGSVEVALDVGLKTTSNLVMDGADNIFFWDNGYLHGYYARRKALFAKVPLTSEVEARNVDDQGQPIRGPEQFLRLMLGPDGTLWANNKLGFDRTFTNVKLSKSRDVGWWRHVVYYIPKVRVFDSQPATSNFHPATRNPQFFNPP